jgi:hypothetical protein
MHKTFLAAIGRAIVEWQDIEHHVFAVFRALVRPTKTQVPLSNAFHTVVVLKTKLDMIDAAAKAALEIEHESLYEKWRALGKKIRNQSTKRNEIAHYSMYLHQDKNKKQSFRLRPHVFDWRYDLNPPHCFSKSVTSWGSCLS